MTREESRRGDQEGKIERGYLTVQPSAYETDCTINHGSQKILSSWVFRKHHVLLGAQTVMTPYTADEKNAHHEK